MIRLLAISGMLLMALYALEMRMVTRYPATHIRLPLLPWGRRRKVNVHPTWIDRLRSEGATTDYRRSARGTAVGRRLPAIDQLHIDPRNERGKTPTVLQPGPGLSALLLVYEPRWAAGVRFGMVAEVTDDAGIAEVRTYLMPRIVPLLILGFLVLLFVQTGGRAPIFAVVAVLTHLALFVAAMRRATTKLRWAHQEIDKWLAIPFEPPEEDPGEQEA